MSDTHTVPTPPPPSEWTTGQRDRHAPLAHGEDTCETALDQDRIPPALAAYAITHYTHPGALVLDPDCGAGTVLVEALRAGRHAVGLTIHHRYGALARANLTTQVECIDHLTGLAGRVDLLLSTLRQHAPGMAHTGPPDPDPLDTLASTLVRCRPLLHSGGHVVITVAPQHHHGHLLTLTRGILAAGHAAGLLAIERYVALLAEPRGTRIITRVSLAQRRVAARHQRLSGHPITRTTHHDVLVFRVPDSAEQVVNGLTTTLAGLDAHRDRDNTTGHPLGGRGLEDTPHRPAAPFKSRQEAA